MMRRLITVASLLSLLAFIAVVVLWYRSISQTDLITRGRAASQQDQGYWTFGTTQGALVFYHLHWFFTGAERLDGKLRLPVGPLRLVHTDSRRRPAGKMQHHFAGFGWERIRFVEGRNSACILNCHTESLAIPLWAISLALLLPPIVILRWLLRTRQLEGHCPACGYDLRASTDRCPECGTPIPTKAIA